MGVTAVLNAAQGTMANWNYVNTKESYYSRCNIKFLGVPALDVKHYPINQHFLEAATFIEDVINSKGKFECNIASSNRTVPEIKLDPSPDIPPDYALKMIQRPCIVRIGDIFCQYFSRHCSRSLCCWDQVTNIRSS